MDDILNIAATLALQSFDRAAMGYQNRADYFNEISPFADAATALRNILSRSPHHFATPDALSTLESECNILKIYLDNFFSRYSCRSILFLLH